MMMDIPRGKVCRITRSSILTFSSCAEVIVENMNLLFQLVWTANYHVSNSSTVKEQETPS